MRFCRALRRRGWMHFWCGFLGGMMIERSILIQSRRACLRLRIGPGILVRWCIVVNAGSFGQDACQTTNITDEGKRDQGTKEITFRGARIFCLALIAILDCFQFHRLRYRSSLRGWGSGIWQGFSMQEKGYEIPQQSINRLRKTESAYP